MLAKTFLSLSFADVDFVRSVYRKLPRGLAYFYEASFETGESLMHAMERAINDTALFVLFASKASLASNAVLFELDTVRAKKVFQKNVRLLIFPTDAQITYLDLPEWLQSHWIPANGWTPNDVARYITNTLLAPEIGLLGSFKVFGRGSTSDDLDRLVTDHLSRKNKSPQIYIIAGVNGIGRRTFADHYMRTSLSGASAINHGPKFTLPRQADLADLYRVVLSDVTEQLSTDQIIENITSFQTLTIEHKINELHRLLGHYWKLGQAVTIHSASGFFEDAGEAKDWVRNLLCNLPENATIFLISNRQFKEADLAQLETAIQIHIPSLSDRDIRALMNHSAARLEISDFQVEQTLVSAVGGHPDIANAAVRLAKSKGTTILTKDPAQLHNIQDTVLGELLDDSTLSDAEKAILSALSWVPALGGDLLEAVVLEGADIDQDNFLGSIQSLLLSCLITVSGNRIAISPAIRQLYRRRFITPEAISNALANVLTAAWNDVGSLSDFREDVFEASVFIHAMRGEKLPQQMEKIISPGLLELLVSESYAHAKNTGEEKDLHRVVTLGSLAFSMQMSEAAREEILSTVTRAQIRMADYSSAENNITWMEERGYRSVSFLKGHQFRHQERWGEAITALKEALEFSKYFRASLHELALSYQRSGQYSELEKMLEKYRHQIRDSIVLTDFQIAMDLAHNRGPEVMAGIAKLRAMPNGQGRAERRQAQLYIKQGRYRDAKDLLTSELDKGQSDKFWLRSLRAQAAAWAEDFKTAQRDVDFVKGLPGRKAVGVKLEAELRAAQGDFAAAEALLSTIEMKPRDYLLQARIFDLKADLPKTPLTEGQALRQRATQLRALYGSTGSSLEIE